MTTTPLRPRIREDIVARTRKILRDLGEPEPPLRLELVRELLKLDLGRECDTSLHLKLFSTATMPSPLRFG